MKHKGKPENRLVTQNENRTYIKLTKGNRYSLVHILDGNCSDSSSKTLFDSFSEIDGTLQQDIQCNTLLRKSHDGQLLSAWLLADHLLCKQ